MRENVKQFIERHIELIEQYKFPAMYGQAEQQIPFQIGNLTVALIQAGINPLNYMSETAYMMFSNAVIEEAFIPDNIKLLNAKTFESCYFLKKISLPEKLERIHMSAFQSCYELEHIEYRGTTDQWRNVNAHYAVFADCNTQTVHCSDGDVVVL